MARTFDKNTSNYVSWANNTIARSCSTFAKIAISVMIKPASFTTNKYRNVVFNSNITTGGLAGLWMSLHDGAGSAALVAGGRSQSSDSFQERVSTATLSTGVWTQIGAMLDIGGDTITPYVAGAASNGGAVTFGATTFTQTATTVTEKLSGLVAGAVNTDHIDGDMAEFAVWRFSASDGLSAEEWAALGKGISPGLVRPYALVTYNRIIGRASPEDAIHSAAAPFFFAPLNESFYGTVNGTLAQAAHPPMVYPGRARVFPPAGVTAATQTLHVLTTGMVW